MSPLALHRLPVGLMVTLPVMVMLLSLCTCASGFVYLSHTIAHAVTPLQTSADTSVTVCAILCRMTTGCIKWSHDSASRLCSLYPLHSDSNPLTSSPGSVFQPVLPEGFILSDDPTIAYRQRAFSLVGGNASLIASCRAYDPESFPAFPHTQQQVSYIKTHVIGSYFWVGMSDQETEGQWKDMTTGQVATLLPQWWWNSAADTSTSNNCMTLYSGGFWAVPCSGTQDGHICQYNIQPNGRRPLE